MDNFSKEVKVLEAQFTYSFQGMMESIHSEVYSQMIETYVDDPREQAVGHRAVEQGCSDPAVQKAFISFEHGRTWKFRRNRAVLPGRET